MAVITCYVADEYWNAGLGHRMRFEALEAVLTVKGGYQLKRVGQGTTHCELDAGGNLVIAHGDTGQRVVLDDLRYALLRPQFARNRPPAPLDHWWPTVTCPPSTRALEAACLGFRVILTEPRNDGEYRLYQRLLDAQRSPGLFDAIDGQGADRCADLLIQNLS